jgi:DNA-binding GntR family transcriptional regulator
LEEVIRKEKFSNQACEYIRDKIISGEYKEGERLVETKVAKELGISQSPVREALRELEVMGLIEIKPYSGCFVQSVNEKRLQQIYELRAVLESFAAREGISNLTPEALDRMSMILHKMELAAVKGDKTALAKYDVQFHSVIVEASDNSMLGRIWKLVGAQQWTAMTINLHKDILYFPESHKKLLQLAELHDVEGYCSELDYHFKFAAKTVVTNAIKKQPD